MKAVRFWLGSAANDPRSRGVQHRRLFTNLDVPSSHPSTWPLSAKVLSAARSTVSTLRLVQQSGEHYGKLFFDLKAGEIERGQPAARRLYRVSQIDLDVFQSIIETLVFPGDTGRSILDLRTSSHSRKASPLHETAVRL
jgi:hypothetical protein